MSTALAKMLARGGPRRHFPSLAVRGLDSGVHRLLENSPAPNSVAPTLLREFCGAQAAAGGLPEAQTRITALALQAGTAPTYGRSVPYLGSRDGAVLGNGGGYFLSGNTDDGNVSTLDILPRVLAKVVASKVIFAKRTTGVGYVIGFNATTALYLTIQDSSGSVTVTSDELVAGTIVFAECPVNRDDATMGGRWLVNGAWSGTLVDCSARALTLDAAVALAVLADSAGANQFTNDLLFCAIYGKAAWYRAGADGVADALADHLRQHALLTGARPLFSAAAATGLVAGGNAGIATQSRLVSGVGALYSMAAGAPRFVQRLDADGRTFRGALVEAGGAIPSLGHCGTETHIFSLAVIGTQLYAGSAETGTVWRYDGGTTWTSIGRCGTEAHIRALAVIGTQLYAGSYPSGTVWRYDGGTTWTSIGRCGSETQILSLAVIGTQLYAGSYPTGTVWRYDGGTTWTSIGRCGSETHIFSLAVIGTQLYAGSNPTGTVWRYDGGTTWTSIGRCGSETEIRSLAAIGMQLYAGSALTGTVWRYDGGTTWTSIGRCGSETYVFSLAVIGTQLYAGSAETGTVWRYDGGTTWTSIGRCGSETYVFSLAVIGTQLYAGSYPSGTVWRPASGTSPLSTLPTAADAPHRYSGAAHFGAGRGALFCRFLAPLYPSGPIRAHHLATAYLAGSAATEYLTISLESGSGHLLVSCASASGNAGAVELATNFCDDKIHDLVVSWEKNKLIAWVDRIASSVDTDVTPPPSMDTVDGGADQAAANQVGPVLFGEIQMSADPVQDPSRLPAMFGYHG